MRLITVIHLTYSHRRLGQSPIPRQIHNFPLQSSLIPFFLFTFLHSFESLEIISSQFIYYTISFFEYFFTLWFQNSLLKFFIINFVVQSFIYSPKYAFEHIFGEFFVDEKNYRFCITWLNIFI